jgi:hypothetical protein
MPRSSPSGRRPVGDHGLGRERLAEVDERGVGSRSRRYKPEKPKTIGGSSIKIES